MNSTHTHIPPLTATEQTFCRELLQRMTLSEKIGQMVQADLSWKEPIEDLIRAGRLGSLLSVRDSATILRMQKIAVEESRLKIPLLVGNDIIHGHRTAFPIPLALSSSWNTDLIERVARASAEETAIAGTNWNYSPMVDICRDPRWGRIAEGAGEDPFLGRAVAQAWVKGYQSLVDKDNHPLIATCVKHFAAYGGAEAGKDYNTVDMSERRLREEYLPPYKAAIDAGALTIMTSFNDLNGIPATANHFLLQQLLREEWGFEGVVVSDYDAIGELILHGFTSDHKQAALLSILAGVDIDMMGNAYHYHLADLVEEGKVPLALIDAAVLRVLQLKVRLGLFKHPYIDLDKISAGTMTSALLDLSTQAASNSAVLLKNDGQLLPLQNKALKVAMIGPMVHEHSSLVGCWTFDTRPAEVETLAEAFAAGLPKGSQLIVEPGCSINGIETDFSAAVAAASQADVVLLALGEHDTMNGEAHCRAHIGLPGKQADLVHALAKTGKPMAALLVVGRPLVLTDVVDELQAVLVLWNGGSRAAQAACDLVMGRAVPTGKTTASWPRSVGQIPVYYAHKSTGRPVTSTGTIQFNESHRSSYLDEDHRPFFPFGFGLSYTTFAYADLVVPEKVSAKDDCLHVTVTVTNTGKVDGTEIVQLYVRDLVGSVTRPVKELKAFQRIDLAAGKSKQVELCVPVDDLRFLDQNLRPILEPGEYHLWVGPDSSTGLQSSFTLTD